PDGLHIIEIREAWKTWPATAAGVAPTRPIAGDLAARVKNAVEAAHAAWQAAGEAMLAQIRDPLRSGQILTVLGRTDAARGAFEAQTTSLPGPAWNNLGNLAALAGDWPAARQAYDRSLAAHDDPRVQINAALAAFGAGDEAGATEHIFQCLDKAGDAGPALVEQIAAMGTSGGAGRGARGGVTPAELRRLVDSAYQRAGKAAPTRPEAARASDQATALPVSRYCHWL
ncbi:MAG: hypothetical protein KC620_04570, partial [Myxococcales bacterium]|nr:hypothetical protein [Myxococcales bacterium]